MINSYEISSLAFIWDNGIQKMLYVFALHRKTPCSAEFEYNEYCVCAHN